MKRLLLLLSLFGCGASPETRSPQPRTFVCEQGADRVVYDSGTASYFSNGAFVGSSECGPTHMRGFDWACTQNPAFRFLFPNVRGAARLDAGGRTVSLPCR